MKSSTLIVETSYLTFGFTSKTNTLQNLNLEVQQGSIYGFLGPNGAGKTTTLRLILGLLKSNKSCIQLFGQDLQSNRLLILGRLGSLIEQPSIYSHLTARENLKIFGIPYRCPAKRVDEVLEIVGLTSAAGKKTKAYSLGMKQRLSIAIALLHDPELLILDEPTNGLDPMGIVEVRDLIRKLNQEMGKTILVSSHLLSEVEKMAAHVGIIHGGKLLFQGTLEALQNMKTAQTMVEVEVDDPEKAVQVLGSRWKVKRNAHPVILVDAVDREAIASLNTQLVQNGIKVYRIGDVKDDLEQLFMQIISS